MLINRQTLSAETVTEFAFEKFESPSVVIKNMTDGEILFCDMPFDASKALHVPAHSWQAVAVSMPIGQTPSFYIKADSAGEVEVDFGSAGMGGLDAMELLDKAGMFPHSIAITAGDGTTLTAEIVRKHDENVDLDTPIEITSSATLFIGDTVKFTAACSVENHHAVLTVNGTERTLESGTFTLTVDGDTTASTEAVAD